MKIGIDARLWSGTGVGRYIRNLVANLTEIDHKNQYILFALKSDEKEIAETLETRVRKNWKIIETNIRWHTAAEQFVFPKLLYWENLDLVHFPYFSVPVLYKKPFILTLHDLIINKLSTGRASTLPYPLYKLKRLGYGFVISQAIKTAKKITVPTNIVKEDLMKHLKVPEGKIVVTYEGASFEMSNVKYPISNFKLKGQSYFLYVGNAYPHKNLERLIDAFKSIKEQGVRVKLVLVGKEDYFYKRLRQEIKQEELEDTIIFYGYATDEELLALYKNAKACVIPSLMEGFGLTSVEAMSLGCPVLASDIPVMREVCQDAAIFFNPKNVEDISGAILKFDKLPTKKIQELKDKGEKQAKKFSWGKMAKETYHIYQQVLPNSEG